MCKIFDNRNDMINQLLPKNGVYAELGVFSGDFSENLHSILQPSQLVLIDLFNGVNGSGDHDGNNFKFEDLNVVFNRLVQTNKFYVMKGDSVQSLLTFPDQYFDMIYIDGDHSYKGCKRDLEASLLKVKKGGWIMGHDYEMNMNKAKTSWNFGVKQAVDQFCKTHNLKISAKGMDGCVSYAINLT
jgi:hypothetical protein